jgi:hypothetical protein
MKQGRVSATLSVALLIADHIALYVWGMALHIWTSYIAYRTGSFVVTLLTFCLPFFAEAVWFIALWLKTGQFFSWYTFGVLAWVVLAIPVFVIGWKSESGGYK